MMKTNNVPRASLERDILLQVLNQVAEDYKVSIGASDEEKVTYLADLFKENGLELKFNGDEEPVVGEVVD